MGVGKSKVKKNSESLSNNCITEINFKSFKILRSIGKGAFGKVCIAQRVIDSKMYAMKYMSKDLCLKKQTIKLVIEEVSILQTICHDFIVNLWFTFQDHEDFFLVVDLMLGGDLDYHLTKGVCFSENDLMIYMLQLGSAIDYIHSKNIVHRDIKPANILLSENGNLSLSDFNVAKRLGSKDELMYNFAGTKPYAAPEVHKSSKSQNNGYSFPADWWSFAVTMYEVIRSKKPFNILPQTTAEQCCDIFDEGNISFSASLSKPLIDVFLELFVVSTTSRLSDFAQMFDHEFFASVKSSDEIKLLKTEFKPSKKILNYDPKHELEEMLIENKPLHKKKSRLKKADSNNEKDNLFFEEYPNFVRTG